MPASIALAERTGSVSRTAVRWRRSGRQRVEVAVEHVGVEVVLVRDIQRLVGEAVAREVERGGFW